MPGNRQPNSLEGLSLGRVCRQLDGTCRRLQMLSQQSSTAQALELAKRTIRPYYMNALSAHLRSQVIQETLRMLCKSSTRVSAPTAEVYLLALLLARDIKQLKVHLCCYYGCSHQTFLLKLLASEGVGLESLDLARSALLRLDCKLLHSALLNMKNLSSLTLRNIASDVALQVVGRTCPRLVSLDVSHSKQVTDAGLKQLLLQVELRDKVAHGSRIGSSHECTSWSRLKKLLAAWKMKNTKSRNKEKSVLLEYCESRNSLCDTLRVLNVENTAVTSAGVLLALMHLPQLVSLAQYTDIGRVMELMSKEFVDLNVPFNLTQAISYGMTLAQLRLLARACPKLVKLQIFDPHHSPEALRLFSCVTSLSLHDVPAEREWLDAFYNYLRTNGQNLRELKCWVLRSENSLRIDLREVLSSCPNLHTLVEDGLNVVWSEGRDPTPLKHLRRIELGHTVNALAITKVLSLAPELTTFHVYCCSDLTNEHLEKLLRPLNKSRSNCKLDNKYTESLQNLTCFFICYLNDISEMTILNMFYNCKQLKRFGYLDINHEDKEILKTILMRADINADLCSKSHWLWNNCI